MAETGSTEEWLQFGAAAMALADAMDRIKTELEGRGWTAKGAEAGAASCFSAFVNGASRG